MFGIIKSISLVPRRSFKNFGHKREPIPTITVLWHGFLTFSFIGLGLNWDLFSRLIFGEQNNDEEIHKNNLK